MEENNKSNALPQEESMNLSELFSACLYRWKWFVISVVLALGIAVTYLLVTPPVYLRSASVLVKEENKGNSMNTNVDSFTDLGLFTTKSNINNELVTIKSLPIITQAVRQLRLDYSYYEEGRFHNNVLYGSTLPVKISIPSLGESDRCSFTMQLSDSTVVLSEFVFNEEELSNEESFSGRIDSSIMTPLGNIIVEPSPYFANKNISIQVSKKSLNSAVNDYTSRLNASLVNDKTTIINLSIEDVSRQRADDFLNALILAYNDSWIQDKNQITVSTSRFINERLMIIEQELGSVDSDISSFKSENLIPDIDAVSSMYMRLASEANSQIMVLENEREIMSYVRSFVVNESNTNELLPANTGINSSIVERQIAEYNDKMLQRNSLIANSSENNPLVADLDKSLSSMRGAIISSIDTQIGSLDTQINSLRHSEQQSTAHIASNPDQSKYLLSVERQQKVKESLYLFLLQKREENELSQAFTAYNTRVVTPPSGKSAPAKPVKRNILLIAFVLGLLLPLGIVFLIENFNTRIRGRKDLEHLSVPFIGEIPLYNSANDKKKRFGKKPAEENLVVVKAGSRNMINEAFRVVRTNLDFITHNGEYYKLMAITSFNPGSGKSFLSLNIALTLAIKKRKVLLIDGDMRKASVSSYVGSPKQGFSDYLSGNIDDYKSLLVNDPNYENLHILPVGTLPPNPTELLSSHRKEELFNAVREEYDYILIDCPPVDIVADTQIIEKDVDRTIFVARAGLLERSMLPEIESIYSEKRHKNMVLILNGTDIERGQYSYKYGYRYGYKYGYAYSYYSSENDKGGGVNG